MKVLYAVEAVNLRGGYDRIIIEKANYLAEHGCEVILCVSSHALSKPFYPISEKVKLVDFDIDFDQQYKHSLFIRAYIYKKLMCCYRKKLSNLLNIEQCSVWLKFYICFGQHFLIEINGIDTLCRCTFLLQFSNSCIENLSVMFLLI